MKQGTKRLDEVCEGVGVPPTMEFVDRMFVLVRMGWISEDDRAYSLTPEGARQLEAQGHRVEDVPKPRTSGLGRRPDETSQTSSSTPVPMFHARVERYGNPRAIPFTHEEMAEEAARLQNLKAMRKEEERRSAEMPPVVPW